ncbi:proline dipeptidase [Gallibacterium genomosp. 3]|uniref:Xaa-Pro dipeptidase n=1 Tax=Gallibacterium genomosp. 3 TaxID=505345 RepID=A0A1A7PPS1_9PAST|nr:Xaa-Pro dipeptidase [Gallibacterium genomosp. 3]OBX04059.1 proline dipeptidase [Gallibacterium genomosp. 3]
MKTLFNAHLAHIQEIIKEALSCCRLDGVWIYAGQADHYFLDDQTKSFHINPYFNYVVPMPKAEGSWVFLDGYSKPKLYFYQPKDYWYFVEALPDDFWCDAFEWEVITQPEQIRQVINNRTNCAFIGEDDQLAKSLGFFSINDRKLLNILNYYRAYKTEYEIECIFQAQKPALFGHIAAKQAFEEGQSEFAINLAYLQASEQSDLNVPYGNIIAINEHGAVLHYNRLATKTPETRRSFLIDAGATYLGYASDITRTYQYEKNDLFAGLLQGMEQIKRDIIAELQVGYNYLTYHTQVQQRISKLLQESGLINLPAEQIFDLGINRAFLPHGLGHFLGLQVHDIGGWQQNKRGAIKRPPEVYPSLRCTRELAEGMVLTIEPGLYFIELLLQEWRAHPLADKFDWRAIEMLKGFGGIRTEDNIVMRATGAENLTVKMQQTLNLS